jgi:hypothetical protein
VTYLRDIVFSSLRAAGIVSSTNVSASAIEVRS